MSSLDAVFHEQLNATQLRGLTFDNAPFVDAHIDALCDAANVRTELTSLVLLRDIYNEFLGFASSDRAVAAFASADRLKHFEKLPMQAVSPFLHQTLCDWLSRTTRLSSFSIGDHIGNMGRATAFPDDAARASLLEAAVCCSTMTTLKLELPYTLSQPVVFDRLVAALGSSAKQLCSMRFNGCNLAAPATTRIVTALSHVQLLSTLDLSRNTFDADGVAAIGALRSLVRLKLQSVQLVGATTLHTLLDCVAEHRGLRTLHLSQNSAVRPKAVAQADIDALVNVLSSPTSRLQLLDVSFFKFVGTPHGLDLVGRVAAALESNIHITTLSISGQLEAAWLLHVARNRGAQWPVVRERLVEIAIALAELDLPAYVTLDIVDEIAPFRHTRHGCKIAALILVKNAWMRAHSSSM